MKEKFLKIINHYGVNHQQRKFQEEVFELNEAILEHEHFKEYSPAEASFISINENHRLSISEYEYELKQHIAEEIADVCVMLHQFVEYYGITPVEIYRFMEQKIGRQIERIGNEKQ